MDYELYNFELWIQAVFLKVVLRAVVECIEVVGFRNFVGQPLTLEVMVLLLRIHQ